MQGCICRCVFVFFFFLSVSEATPFFFFSEKALALPQLAITAYIQTCYKLQSNATDIP